MKVFLSWSGEESHYVAARLRDWLPDVIQDIEPWMSSADIAAGARWSTNIQRQLSETSLGILCVTRENQGAPWLVFEAGALAKTIDGTYVCPYLIDMTAAQLEPGPLTQFQAKSANEEGTFDLLRTLNRAGREDHLPDDKLRRSFSKWWPELEQRLKTIPVGPAAVSAPRPMNDMIEEVLVAIRDMQRVARTAPLNIFQPLRAFMHTSTPEQRTAVARQMREALSKIDDDTFLMPEFWAGFVGGFVDAATQARVAKTFGADHE